jgi:hypothetical protein
MYIVVSKDKNNIYRTIFSLLEANQPLNIELTNYAMIMLWLCFAII